MKEKPKKFEFFKKNDEERIVKRRRIERLTNEELKKELVNVISGESAYKQIVVWETIREGWTCTFRSQIVGPEQIEKEDEAKDCPDQDFFLVYLEYNKDEEYWVIRGRGTQSIRKIKKIIENYQLG